MEQYDTKSDRWVLSVTAEKIWQALRLCCIDEYVGPPNVIAYEAGKNFLAEFFQMNADLFSILIKAFTMEFANSMSIVERYHDPVRRAYRIIKAECPNADEDLTLQMAVKESMIQ